MSILAALNAKTLELRKARDPLAAVFQQIQAGASAAAKERALDAEVTDADATAALKKAEKNVKDMITVLDDQIREMVFNESHPLFVPRMKAKAEIEAIQALLPQKADPEEVRRAVRDHLSRQEDKSMKAMGGTMAFLRTHFGDSLDNAEASAIIRSELA